MPIINIWWKCGCHYAIASVHNWWWILFLSLVVTSHQCQVSALTLGSRGQWPRQPRPGQPQHSLNPSGARADAASPLELETNLLEDSSFTITEKALSNYLSVSKGGLLCGCQTSNFAEVRVHLYPQPIWRWPADAGSPPSSGSRDPATATSTQLEQHNTLRPATWLEATGQTGALKNS